MMPLTNEQGILLITDPPKSMEFGVDILSYTTGDSFQGMSCIPAGFHLCYYNVGISNRQGFFFYIPSTPTHACVIKQNTDVSEFRHDRLGSVIPTSAIIVRAYDKYNEQILAHNQMTEEQLNNLQEAIHRGQFNQGLGPYPLDQVRIQDLP